MLNFSKCDKFSAVFQGTQHKRKAEQFFQQYQHNQRRKNSFNESATIENSFRENGTNQTAYLSQLRRDTQLLGLQYIEQYTSTDRNDPPLYMCILKGCKVNNSVS